MIIFTALYEENINVDMIVQSGSATDEKGYFCIQQ